MHVHIGTYIHTYIHAYIHTYIHTYIRTHTHTRVRFVNPVSAKNASVYETLLYESVDMHLPGIQPVAVHLVEQAAVPPETGNSQPSFHFNMM